MTKDQQFYDLCNKVKCTLRPSSIHGIGVFALRDLKAGERLYCNPDERPFLYSLTFKDLERFNTTHPEIKEMILARWPVLVNGGQFLSPNYDARLVSFINHSDTPNYQQTSDTALRDIKSGEEITENFRTMKNHELAYPWLASTKAKKVV